MACNTLLSQARSRIQMSIVFKKFTVKTNAIKTRKVSRRLKMNPIIRLPKFPVCKKNDVSHELIEIENHKRSLIEHDVVINPPAFANPVEFVSKIADNLILKIVNNVCREANEEDLVQKQKREFVKRYEIYL